MENIPTQNELIEPDLLVINHDDLSTNNILVPENVEPNMGQPATFKLPELPVAPIKVPKRVRSKLPSMLLTISPVKLHLEQKKKLKKDLIQSKKTRKEVNKQLKKKKL